MAVPMPPLKLASSSSASAQASNSTGFTGGSVNFGSSGVNYLALAVAAVAILGAFYVLKK